MYIFMSLRDGAQTQGVDFSVADKAAIARELDGIGIDYIEGGWPGANPDRHGVLRTAAVVASRTAIRLRHDPALRPQRRQ